MRKLWILIRLLGRDMELRSTISFLNLKLIVKKAGEMWNRNLEMQILDKISKLKKYQIKSEKLSKNDIFFCKPKWNITKKKICFDIFILFYWYSNEWYFVYRDYSSCNL